MSAIMFPPGGAMDVLFSFDTTGSMSSILHEVQGRLQEMIQRLQADIPGIRIGVIAHGDYCDEKVFYLEKHIDFSQKVADLCTFVGGVEGTGGGDQDECYELILRKVRKDFSWAPVSNKVLVLIGDANPHEPDYDMNVDNIDWREEVKLLAEQNVKIYAVQAFDNEGVDEFYKTMAEQTMGHYLKLDNFSNICDFIMAICYRERGDDFFTEYETEVRARYAKSGLQKDLEGMFGTLRRDDSVNSGTTFTFSAPLTSLSSVPGVAQKRSASPPFGFSAPFTLSSIPPLPKNVKLSVNKTVSTTCSSVASNIKLHTAKPIRATATKRKNKTKSQLFTGKPRETIPERKFALRRFKWSSWRLVYTPNKPTCEKSWRKIMKERNCWRRKEFFPPLDKFGSDDKILHEISVQTRPKCRRHVVYYCITDIPFDHRRNWEYHVLGRAVDRTRMHRQQINRVLKSGCNVFIRRAHVKKRQVKQLHKLAQYHYAWMRSISGKAKPERKVVKNKILISGMEY